MKPFLIVCYLFVACSFTLVLADEGVFDNAEVARLKQVRLGKSVARVVDKPVQSAGSVEVEVAVLRRLKEREELEAYVCTLPGDVNSYVSDSDRRPEMVQAAEAGLEKSGSENQFRQREKQLMGLYVARYYWDGIYPLSHYYGREALERVGLNPEKLAFGCSCGNRAELEEYLKRMRKQIDGVHTCLLDSGKIRLVAK